MRNLWNVTIAVTLLVILFSLFQMYLLIYSVKQDTVAINETLSNWTLDYE